MNRLRSRRLYRAVLVLVLVFWIVAGGTAKAADSTEKQEAIKTLEKAMEQSKQSGKPVVIDLAPEDPGTVQAGDLVVVNYTARLEDGSLIATTRKDAAENTTNVESPSFHKRESFGPEEVLAGKPGSIPGIGEAIIGLKNGEKKTLTLPPERAFGSHDPKKTAQFPCERRMPKIVRLDPRSYVNQFGAFPIVGKEVDLTPYFQSKVIEVAENYVKLEALAKGGERSEDEFGTTEMRIDDDQIVATLSPKIGADFEMSKQTGKIVYADGSMFTVDFNPPLAGKPVVIELEVVSLTKASEFKGMEIAWLEDHDKALEKAKAEKKPMVLMLYAPWCSWSKKLVNESMEDPRVKVMKDQFIWAKVDSEKQKDVYQFYEQKGYPLTVLLNPQGEVIKKIDGYREAWALKKELEAALATKIANKKSPQTHTDKEISLTGTRRKQVLDRINRINRI